MKKLKVTLFLFAIMVMGLLFPVSSMAEIFIDTFPWEDITVNEGDPLEVPVFFWGGDLVEKPIELFIWKEGFDSQNKEYLGASGWTPFTDFSHMTPVFSIDNMIEYANITWKVYENTRGIDSFSLYICMDSDIDGRLPQGIDTPSASCGLKRITIEQNCTGIELSKNPISESLRIGTNKTITINVSDKCNKAIDFEASSPQNWISLSKQAGVLTVTLNASSLPATTYTGTINISAGASNETIPVTLQVTSSSFTFPTCPPLNVVIWPGIVGVTTASGETKIETVSVTDNCGKALSYTASVTKGSSWLITQASGSGTLLLTINTTGMTPGTYDGEVRVSPSGYSAKTLTVTLTIAGQCTPSSAVINPSSISKQVTVGSNATDTPVTIKDNCSNNLSYKVTAVTGSWITSPKVNDTGTGTLIVKLNTVSLSAGTYNGSITVDLGTTYGSRTIPVSLSMTNTSSDAVLLKNLEIQYYSYDPGQVRYFYFYENSNKGNGNTKSLIVDQMDMVQTYLYNIDMIVKYAGPNCEYGKPTMSDYNDIIAGKIKFGQNNLWFHLSSTAFETVEIPAPNPQGCYYVMVKNADTVRESKISIKYQDFDSN